METEAFQVVVQIKLETPRHCLYGYKSRADSCAESTHHRCSRMPATDHDSLPRPWAAMNQPTLAGSQLCVSPSSGHGNPSSNNYWTKHSKGSQGYKRTCRESPSCMRLPVLSYMRLAFLPSARQTGSATVSEPCETNNTSDQNRRHVVAQHVATISLRCRTGDTYMR